MKIVSLHAKAEAESWEWRLLDAIAALEEKVWTLKVPETVNIYSTQHTLCPVSETEGEMTLGTV